MREAIHFTYDGVSSMDMGVHIISNGNLFEENFLPTRSIVEQSVAKKNKPYFQRVDNEPLSFSLTFFIHQWKENDNLRSISRWLFKDYYKPLSFSTNPERIFYAIVEGDSTLVHNGAKEGYITLNFRCDSPFSYGQKQHYEDIISLSANGNMELQILNDGDLTVKPKIWLKKTISNGNISIKNNTSNQTVTINNLQLNEDLFIDFENETIVSSLETFNVFRYENHNDEWLELLANEKADNHLILTGDFTLEIEFEPIYLAE